MQLRQRLSPFALSLGVMLPGPASVASADVATQLPFTDPRRFRPEGMPIEQ